MKNKIKYLRIISKREREKEEEKKIEANTQP